MPPSHLNARDHVQTLVLDTAPLLTGANLDGLAERYVTIPEVLAEVRDKWSRRNLEFITNYKLEIRQPDEEAMKTGEL